MKIDKPMDIATAVTSAATATQTAAAQGSGRSVAAQQPSSGARNSRVGESGAGVTVSVRARTLVNLSATSSDIDMGKVEAVRSAIAQGTFSVNPEVIADRLLANAKDMLSRSRI